MTILRIPEAPGEEFRVQFRHLSKLTKRQSLHRAPMDVLTTCVVVLQKSGERRDVVGISVGHAMCMPGDNFKKDFARDTSFRRAVRDCALFQNYRPELLAAYDAAKKKSTAPIVETFTTFERKEIAELLVALASTAPEGARLTILQAGDLIKKMGAKSRPPMDEDERQKLRAAGESVRNERSTAGGRAAVNLRKRQARMQAKKQETGAYPRAAG